MVVEVWGEGGGGGGTAYIFDGLGDKKMCIIQTLPAQYFSSIANKDKKGSALYQKFSAHVHD